jgi:3-deoxy-7-phosphoheptulonate synthase
VILCERGIRTFERSTRYTLDLNSVALIRQLTHLPIIVDPSHAAGRHDLVGPLAKAGLAVGAHGLIIETHPEPENARSDADQQLNFAQFQQLYSELNQYAPLVLA